MTWSRLGLVATFTACRPTGRATGFTGFRTWSTSSGLRVGMPESAIVRLYPGAQHVAESGGQTLWYLVPRSGRPGADALTATTSALGTIGSLSLASTVESGNAGQTTSGTVIWGAP